jgi:hypothetical protein
MRFRTFILVIPALFLPILAYAQSPDGRYTGRHEFVKGENCGDKNEFFWTEVKGKSIRIFSGRAQRTYEGDVKDGAFKVSGSYHPTEKAVKLEWSGKISGGRVTGSFKTSSGPGCQYKFSLGKV